MATQVMAMPLEDECGSFSMIARSLKVPGLGLVAVYAQVARLGVVLGQEGPLEPGGEPGPAAAAQVRPLDLVDDLRRPHLQGLLEALVAAVPLVGAQGPRVGGAPAAGQDPLDGHFRSS
jgi:hypothetical protein